MGRVDFIEDAAPFLVFSQKAMSGAYAYILRKEQRWRDTTRILWSKGFWVPKKRQKDAVMWGAEFLNMMDCAATKGASTLQRTAASQQKGCNVFVNMGAKRDQAGRLRETDSKKGWAVQLSIR